MEEGHGRPTDQREYWGQQEAILITIPIYRIRPEQMLRSGG
jgi:hypothetical protein